MQNIRSSALAKKLLKKRSAVLIHPCDADQKVIEGQLRVAAIETTTAWPYPDALPETAGLAIVYVERAAPEAFLQGLQRYPGILLAVAAPDDVAALDMAVVAGCHGLLIKPVRPSGVMAQVYVAAGVHAARASLRDKAAHLEVSLRERRTIEKAVRCVVAAQGLSHEEAYEFLRRHAMDHRCTVVAMAQSVLASSDPAVLAG
jgi:two-component system, response regulator PdtaR